MKENMLIYFYVQAASKRYFVHPGGWVLGLTQKNFAHGKIISTQVDTAF
jgi:hypothetical protein